MAVRRKLPFALCPGPQEDGKRTKDITKESLPQILLLSRGGRGEEQRLFPTSSAQLLGLLPPLLFPFHSALGVPALTLALRVFLSRSWTRLPTSVEERKSSTT